jgi:hypothetical protein
MKIAIMGWREITVDNTDEFFIFKLISREYLYF